MKNAGKFIGIIVFAAVIGFTMTGCPESDPGTKDIPWEEKPVADRWGKWEEPGTTATLEYSVGDDEVCTVTVTGQAQPNMPWNAQALYFYTAETAKSYVYTFEAWTGSGNRYVDFQYYYDNDNLVYLSTQVTITSTRETYTVYGEELPNGEIGQLAFFCADQLGTFHVKILKIEKSVWTAVTNSKFGTDNILSIAYGNGKFVAGGSSGKMAYSSDGVTWTTVMNSPFSAGDAVLSIAWGNGKFVAGSDYGKLSYSSDGITWTAVNTTAFGSYYDGFDDEDDKVQILAIAWGGTAGNEKFVAGGSGGGRVAYSSDGINWIALSDSPFGAGLIFDIAWGNGKFVAVGAGDDGAMAYSSDGISWTAVDVSQFNTNNIFSIVWGNNKFVAGMWNGNAAYSSDGINWTAVTNSPLGTNSFIQCIAWGNGKFVAGGGATQGSNYISRLAYSSDGITWTDVSDNPIGAGLIHDIAWGNNKFVAVGMGVSGGKMAYWSGN